MKKQELVKVIAMGNWITNALAKNVIDSIFDRISKELKSGNSVAVTWFGSFSTSKRKARTARNPKTGENVKVKERVSARFKAGKTLKDLLK